METTSVKRCTMCHADFETSTSPSLYAEAGEWLAAEVWKDAGDLCPRCLESRATLAMMYFHECNR